MTDADLIETGAHVDTAITKIADIVAARDGTDPKSPDARVIASIAAISMVVHSLYLANGWQGVKFAMDAMQSLESDYRQEVTMRLPRTASDKVN